MLTGPLSMFCSELLCMTLQGLCDKKSIGHFKSHSNSWRRLWWHSSIPQLISTCMLQLHLGYFTYNDPTSWNHLQPTPLIRCEFSSLSLKSKAKAATLTSPEVFPWLAPSLCSAGFSFQRDQERTLVKSLLTAGASKSSRRWKRRRGQPYWHPEVSQPLLGQLGFLFNFI